MEEREIPLSRNRDYTILWVSRFISEIAGEIAYLAIPLVVLSAMGSPWQLGVAASVLGAAQIVGVIPAGILADRMSRKTIMLVTEAIRLVNLTAFVVVLLGGWYSFPILLVVAAIEGAMSAAFAPAEDAALPGVVGKAQLVQALARNTSRTHLAALLGPAMCGALFAIHQVTPFAVDVGIVGLSLIALAFLRLPHRGATVTAGDDEQQEDAGDAAGIRWVLRHSGLRATLIWVASAQLLTTALVVLVLSQAGEADTSPGEIGFVMTMYGAGGLLGSFAAERLHHLVRPSHQIIGFSWLLAVLVGCMALVPVGLPLGILLGMVAFFVPTAFTTIMGYQLAVTPDGSRGRLSGLLGIATGLATTIGPLLGAFLISIQNQVSPFALAALGLAAVAFTTTISPDIRGITRLDTTSAGDAVQTTTQ